MQEINDIEIAVPEGVKNVEQYKKWYRLKQAIDNNPDRYYKTVDNSGVEIIIDLYSPSNIIRKKFADKIPSTLMEELVLKINSYKSQMAKCTVEQRKINSTTGYGYVEPAEILANHSTELIEMFGKYWNSEEVHKYIVENWKAKTVSIGSVRKFYQKYKVQIAKLRAAYDEDYSDISLHSKRARLAQLNSLLCDRKQIYDKTHKIEDSREIRAIIDQAKGEVEGNKLQITHEGRIDIDLTINIEQQVQSIGGLTLGQLIVSMTAGKLGVNPMFLMSKLSSSVYSKFNGFKRNDFMMYDTPFKPSSLVYNFEEIKEKNAEYEKELPKQLYVQPIEDVKIISEATSIKEKLLQRIKNKVDETNKNIERMHNNE